MCFLQWAADNQAPVIARRVFFPTKQSMCAKRLLRAWNTPALAGGARESAFAMTKEKWKKQDDSRRPAFYRGDSAFETEPKLN